MPLVDWPPQARTRLPASCSACPIENLTSGAWIPGCGPGSFSKEGGVGGNSGPALQAGIPVRALNLPAVRTLSKPLAITWVLLQADGDQVVALAVIELKFNLFAL